ncbi:zinc-binding dehydrogenase [Phlyctema vagabunda]|uniref:Zinc-binding dehydrogenase n=1 Tax=Phlyctema vagabunda TaxID=108571 RepID=A0ABR4PJJ3_9HELO
MRGIQITEYVKVNSQIRCIPDSVHPQQLTEGQQLTQHQGPDALRVENLPDPKPAKDQYLIAIHASAANFFDLLQIAGKYQHQPPLPWISGSEFAGVVLAVPASVAKPRFQVGDKVFGASQGGYATKVAAKEESLQPVPQGWSFFEAAGLFVTAPTSYGALVTRAGVKQGDYVLVHAAAGGVGLAAVQIAKAFGATVIATAGTARKLEVAKSFGADYTIDYTDPTWPDQVKKITPKGRGVDIVFDPVGMIDKSTKCIRWNGRLLVIGFAAGAIEKVAMNKVLLKNISIVGLHWGAYTQNEPETIPEVWAGLFKLIDQGKFKGTVFTDQEFVGLETVPEALKSLGGRGTWGKVVVKVPQEGQSKL